MDIVVKFPGGKRVDAEYKGFTVKTDQPVQGGGGGTAPSPFDLFLCSIGTCAGIYVLNFCQERNIPTDGSALVLGLERDPESKMIRKISIDINLPKDFPRKYSNAVRSAAELCPVKKHIANAPAFDIKVNIG
jgi:ribosomal protein S12 methylthiotransferase accessory factor